MFFAVGRKVAMFFFSGKKLKIARLKESFFFINEVLGCDFIIGSYVMKFDTKVETVPASFSVNRLVEEF
jgi:hypothetical protein